MCYHHPHKTTLLATLPIALFLVGFSTLSEAQLFFPNRDAALIERGRLIFFNETFNGNGRTCGTCHRAENNMTIDPAFIATLPNNDPLFVAEFTPALKKNFENPRLMREFGLILENQDGFNDLENNFNMRGVPHVLAQRTSVDSTPGPRTGWAGDGAPNDPTVLPSADGTLRAFAIGAVRQHFTKTTARTPGVDFRFPTEHELDALEAFQLSLGRQADLQLPLPLKGTVAKRGQEIFRNLGVREGEDPTSAGKCDACHFNAGANAHPIVAGALGIAGNLNFNTGVEKLPDQPADLTGELVPPDDGFDPPAPVIGEFNTPPLVEAADTGPFFHNNAVETIEGAVAFYNDDAFNDSEAGKLVIGATGSGIDLSSTQVVAVAAFLRVINALENIRQSIELLQASGHLGFFGFQRDQVRLAQAIAEAGHAIDVLGGGGLHPRAVAHLEDAERYTRQAASSLFGRHIFINEALRKHAEARDVMIDTQP